MYIDIDMDIDIDHLTHLPDPRDPITPQVGGTHFVASPLSSPRCPDGRPGHFRGCKVVPKPRWETSHKPWGNLWETMGKP